jgi:hypothetical protein
MKPNNGGVKQSSKETYKGGVANRRNRAKERLETQLVSKVKPNKEKLAGNDVNVPLTEQDIKRINKEIEILKAK